MSVSSLQFTTTVNNLLKDIQAQSTYPKLKTRIQSRDFARENIKRIRQLSASKKRDELTKETDKLQPIKADWKARNHKYDHVKSKVSALITPSNVSALITPSNKRFGDTENVKKPIVPPLMLNRENEDPLRRRPPSSSSSIETFGKGRTSYIKQNAINAKLTQIKRSSSATDLDLKKNQYMPGFVPKYLIERKKQLLLKKEREEEMEEIERRPDGLILMSEVERLKTLKQMKANEEKLLEKLASLPICMVTLRIRKEKDQMEQQLAKLEEGIKIFSRPKVYIKDD